MNTSDLSNPRRGGAVLYALVMLLLAAVTGGIFLLYENIAIRKTEALQNVFRIVELNDDIEDPAEWGKNYPRQYDSYKRTVDIERTRYGGSENIQKLDDQPVLRTLFDGYAFAIDYREERGHAYMLSDQEETLRVTQRKQPGACLHCHASVLPAYAKAGRENGAPADDRQAQIMKGFEVVCAMPYGEANQLVSHPVTCVDCHDPETMGLRVMRPGFLNGIQALANSDSPVPHMPSVERWRKGDRAEPYNPNTLASRQEMRSFVCGQCHVEYYFKGEGKLLTYPWHHGLTVDGAEQYYDEVGFHDWIHTVSKAPVLKAQHPEFELWSQGIHARSGVACADCHMPYKREGAIKISDHHVRSPLLNVNRACQTCHPLPEQEILARVATIQDRTRGLMTRGEEATVALIHDIQKAMESGASDEDLKAARDYHRKAQFRLDYVHAENSMGFHAPQESARILAEAIDYARQGQLEVRKSSEAQP